VSPGTRCTQCGAWRIENRRRPDANPEIVAFVELIVSLGVFASLFAFSVGLFKRILSIQRKLSHYKEYRRDIIHRWGKEEVSKIEAEL
jgi:hypothetical protein